MQTILRLVSLVASAGALLACSSSEGSVQDKSGMNAAAAGDSSSGKPASEPAGDADELAGDWQFTSKDPPFAIVFHFKSDGSYESDVVTTVTASLWQDQLEQGTYAVSGSTLTTTPSMWSCPSPDPVASATFSFADGHLVLANAKGAVTAARKSERAGERHRDARLLRRRHVHADAARASDELVRSDLQVAQRVRALSMAFCTVALAGPPMSERRSTA